MRRAGYCCRPRCGANWSSSSDDVQLLCFKQRIEVFGSKVYAERLDAAKSGLSEKLKALEKKGLR